MNTTESPESLARKQSLGRRIRTAREARKWTQHDVADKLSLTGNSTVYKWETAKLSPSDSMLRRLAIVFGFPQWWFLVSEQEVLDIKESTPLDYVRLLAGCDNTKTYFNSENYTNSSSSPDVQCLSDEARMQLGLQGF